MILRHPDSPLFPSTPLFQCGRPRSRDLRGPGGVTQATSPGLPDRFPPLKSLERHPTNLPVQPNPLIGREAELAALRDLLRANDRPTGNGRGARLVTVIGPAGIGKTRLAVQAAAELLDAFAARK